MMNKFIYVLLCINIYIQNSNASICELTEHFPQITKTMTVIPHSIAKRMGENSPNLNDFINYSLKSQYEDDEFIMFDENDDFIVFGDGIFLLGTGDEGHVYLAADKKTGEWLAAKTFVDSLEMCEQSSSYTSLLKLNRLKGIYKLHNYYTYIVSTLVDGVNFCDSSIVYPHKFRTDEGRVLICLNYLKELAFLASHGLFMTDINDGMNMMINYSGHVFAVDHGHTGTYDEPSDHFAVNDEYLDQLCSLWHPNDLDHTEEFIHDGNKDEIAKRPYGTFIMTIFNGKRSNSTKDGCIILAMLNNLMNQHNHPRKITYNKES